MVAQTYSQMQYHVVPGLNLSVAERRACDENGKVILGPRNNAKLWLQSHDLDWMSSKEWSDARSYFELNNRQIENDMITGYPEYVDDMIFWPNYSDGKYSSHLDNAPETGRYPLWVVRSILHTRDDGSPAYVGGERNELPNFPRRSGKLERDIPELGLVAGAYLWSNDDFSYEEGVRAVIRGGRWFPRVRRFGANAYWLPSNSNSYLGFRPVRRGLVITETGRKPVQIEGADFTSLFDVMDSPETAPEEKLGALREILTKYK